MRRFQSVNRTLEAIFGGLKGKLPAEGKGKTYVVGGEIPAHLRRKKKEKMKNE